MELISLPQTLLSTLVSVRQPGVIVGPIAEILSKLYNLLFNGIYSSFQAGTLGVAIILFTLIVKIILFPLMVKQQKSSAKMQMLTPELNKIREKYKDKKDQMSQQKMAYEMQEFQKKNGINMMAGCLPMLIQLPILYALFYIFQNAYVYVDVIGQNYTDIANAIISIPADLRVEVFGTYAQDFVNTYAKELTKLGMTFDLSDVNSVVMLINSLKIEDWANILTNLGSAGDALTPLLSVKDQIEVFLTISLISRCSLTDTSIAIPLLAAATTFLQSKIMLKNTPTSAAGNDTVSAMNKSMLYFMPLMMGFICFSVPAGLGLYWTVSNIFGIVQQLVLQKYFTKKFRGEAAENAGN